VVEVRAHGSADRVSSRFATPGRECRRTLKRPNGRARSSNGSGYGLLAARRFIESNGGQLDFEGLPGGAHAVSRVSGGAGTGPVADR